ncbi:CPXCG motif-containing cysteine-rich protein [Sphingobacteriales bacterium CHB3]|nr:CPXCG motif-containing cysteine-rich protein [Sphingobacteriales bacterium CHB3]
MEIDTTFICAYCLQVNAIVVDGTGGLHQQYIEDCQVCCRPNDLHIVIDEELSEADVQAETA